MSGKLYLVINLVVSCCYLICIFSGNFDTYLTQTASKYNVPELRDATSVLVSVTDMSPGSVGGVGGGGDSNNNNESGWKITAIIIG
jgi:hypothetical protein